MEVGMTTITLKNVPTLLHELIKQHAEENRRSLNNEIIYQLEKAFGLKSPDPQDIIRQARRIRDEITPFLTDEMIDEFKNEGRK